MEFVAVLINVVVMLWVSWWVYRRYARAYPVLYWSSLSVKLLAGLFIGWLYTNYYTSADTFLLFNDSVKLANIATSNPADFFEILWQGTLEKYEAIGVASAEARSIFFIKILSFFSIIARGNYWIVSLYFSLLSFFAAFYFVRLVIRYFPDSRSAAAVAILFFPSVVVWTSGILKETVGLACIYIIAGVFLLAWHRERMKLEVILLVLSVIVLWKIRYFYAGILLPVIMAAFVVKKTGGLNDKVRNVEILAFFVVLGFFILGTTFLHPNFSLNRILEVVVVNYRDFITISNPEDVIHYHNLQPTWTSFLLNSPWAFFSGLLRPMFWEAGNVWQVLAAVENALILILTLLSLTQLSRILKSHNRLLLVSALTYCVFLCTFLALSTPNFGSLARYRVGFLPFFVLIILDQPLPRYYLNKLLGRILPDLFR